MRILAALIVSGLAAFPVSAQFDYGLSAGGALPKLWVVGMDDFHASASVGDVGRTAFSASAFYRERYSDFVDLGIDLVLAHQSFSIQYGYTGLGGSTNKAARAELDRLYLGLKPEVRMDAKRMAVVRFGLMAGFRAGGSARGTSFTWGAMGPGTKHDDADLADDFSGDLRFAFGFGFRIPLGDRWAVTIDPEATFGLTSLVRSYASVRGSDISLRIGLSRRSTWRALTALFKAPPRDPGAAPAW